MKSLFFVCLFLGATWVYAQPGNPNAPTPFGFVEVLAIAGAAYGGKKVRDYHKSKD